MGNWWYWVGERVYRVCKGGCRVVLGKWFGAVLGFKWMTNGSGWAMGPYWVDEG